MPCCGLSLPCLIVYVYRSNRYGARQQLQHTGLQWTAEHSVAKRVNFPWNVSVLTHNSDGMVPVMSLLPSVWKFFKFFKYPNSLQMDPVKILLYSQRFSIRVNFPSSDGIWPVKVHSDTERDFKLPMFPISVGMIPWRPKLSSIIHNADYWYSRHKKNASQIFSPKLIIWVVAQYDEFSYYVNNLRVWYHINNMMHHTIYMNGVN